MGGWVTAHGSLAPQCGLLSYWWTLLFPSFSGSLPSWETLRACANGQRARCYTRRGRKRQQLHSTGPTLHLPVLEDAPEFVGDSPDSAPAQDGQCRLSRGLGSGRGL